MGEFRRDLDAEDSLHVPHSARVWNRFLGGKECYDVDRSAAADITDICPGMGAAVRQARGFLVRAVHHLAAQEGVGQFLDVGCGLPMPEVFPRPYPDRIVHQPSPHAPTPWPATHDLHEVARRAAPDARVLYVDNDPVVGAHAHALLTCGRDGVDFIDADLRDPGDILSQARELLDFSKPIAVVLGAVLGHLGVDPLDPHAALTDPQQARPETRAVVDALIAALPRGSFLAAYDLDGGDPEAREAMLVFCDHGASPYLPLPRRLFGELFDGLEVLPPGVVRPEQWRPLREPDADAPVWCAVGRKL
ncbi:SAM-dependent methyltransferase [Thermomonospora umbrina]|nr:SAM-dependent methyltransferase [Thermomonospora umbrina]